jgi:hypothetical protein
VCRGMKSKEGSVAREGRYRLSGFKGSRGMRGLHDVEISSLRIMPHLGWRTTVPIMLHHSVS